MIRRSSKAQISEIQEDVSGLQEDVSGLQEDVSGLQEDVSGLQEDVSGLQEDICPRYFITTTISNFTLTTRDIAKNIYINGLSLDCSSGKTLELTSNLIASDGTDAQATPSNSTLYYAYLSNASASYAPGEIRLSEIAPIGKYLGSSGNSKHWLWIANVYIESDGTLGSKDVIPVYGNICFVYAKSVDLSKSSGSEGYYDFQSIVLPIPNGKKCSVISWMLFGGGGNNYTSRQKIIAGSNEVFSPLVLFSSYNSISSSLFFVATSNEITTVKKQFYYKTGTVTVYGGNDSQTIFSFFD